MSVANTFLKKEAIELALADRLNDIMKKNIVVDDEKLQEITAVKLKIEDIIDALVEEGYAFTLILRVLFCFWVHFTAQLLKIPEDAIYGTKNRNTIEKLFNQVMAFVIQELKKLPKISLPEDALKLIHEMDQLKNDDFHIEKRAPYSEYSPKQIEHVNLKLLGCLNEFKKKNISSPGQVAGLVFGLVIFFYIRFNAKESVALYFKVNSYPKEVIKAAVSVLIDASNTNILKAKKRTMKPMKTKTKVRWL